MKLPHRETFGILRLKLCSHGQYKGGGLDGVLGFYKGIAGDCINFFSETTGLLSLSYLFFEPVHPTKRNKRAHYIGQDRQFGRRFKVEVFGPDKCEVVPSRGGRKGSMHTVSTMDLAIIG